VRGGGELVTDVLMVVLVVGFFVLAAFFAAWLDRV
jgi:preprotein translocase subunit SecE